MSSNRRSGVLGWFRGGKSQRHDAVLSNAGSSVTISADSADVSASENSAAALRNVQNASNELNEYLQSIDSSEASFRNLADRSRWVAKAQSCSNFSFARCSLPEVKLENSSHELARLAALSALKVYAKPGSAELLSNSFDSLAEELKVNADVLGGTIKAATTGLYSPKIHTDDNSNVIVLAIRGTVTTHDWMVNLNDGTENRIQDAFLGTDEVGGLYSAHAGFLACAKSMNSSAVDHIYQLWMKDSTTGVQSKPRLIFTGHSAGGAVAAMLYAHFLKCDDIVEDKTKSRSLKNAFSSVDCITFGAPPITTKPILPFQKNSIFLSFVNDEGPVPRADSHYINSLLRLFVGPMLEKKGTKWNLPPRVLFNAGTVLIALPSGLIVRPNEFGVGSLAETVMGNKRAHHMVEYRKRLER